MEKLNKLIKYLELNGFDGIYQEHERSGGFFYYCARMYEGIDVTIRIDIDNFRENWAMNEITKHYKFPQILWVLGSHPDNLTNEMIIDGIMGFYLTVNKVGIELTDWTEYFKEEIDEYYQNKRIEKC